MSRKASLNLSTYILEQQNECLNDEPEWIKTRRIRDEIIDYEIECLEETECRLVAELERQKWAFVKRANIKYNLGKLYAGYTVVKHYRKKIRFWEDLWPNDFSVMYYRKVKFNNAVFSFEDTPVRGIRKGKNAFFITPTGWDFVNPVTCSRERSRKRTKLMTQRMIMNHVKLSYFDLVGADFYDGIVHKPLPLSNRRFKRINKWMNNVRKSYTYLCVRQYLNGHAEVAKLIAEFV